jgi:uncharacterized membrane protein
MAALTCVVTMSISIYIPSSEGFFNIGESIVYLSAILFGPYIGALSGGIGSMTADLLLGYPNYAPGTLVIKGIEGFLVGYVYQKLRNGKSIETRKVLIFIITLISIGLLFFLLVTLGVIPNYDGFLNFWEIVVRENLGVLFWILFPILSLAAILVIAFLIRKFFDRDTTDKIISMMIGGIILVIGYFLYGSILYGFVVYVEIPFNMLQSIVGTVIAVPLINPIRKTLKF